MDSTPPKAAPAKVVPPKVMAAMEKLPGVMKENLEDILAVCGTMGSTLAAKLDQFAEEDHDVVAASETLQHRPAPQTTRSHGTFLLPGARTGQVC